MQKHIQNLVMASNAYLTAVNTLVMAGNTLVIAGNTFMMGGSPELFRAHPSATPSETFTGRKAQLYSKAICGKRDAHLKDATGFN